LVFKKSFIMKMSLHRALGEIKLIDSKIEKKTASLVPVGIYQGTKKIGTIELDAFKTAAKSNYDSIMSLIVRKNAIKNLIVAANAITVVEIGNKSMTIADAINYKSLIEYKKELLERLKIAQKANLAELERNNNVVNANLQSLLEKALGKDAVKTSGDEVEAISKPYLEKNEWKFYDPLGITQLIEGLDKEISDFELEVDYKLSEINATTFIEVDEDNS